jgi:uncharacterized protein
MPESKVLDSWALLAWLLDQPAAAKIEALLQRAESGARLEILMSWINLGEVYYITARRLGQARAEEVLKRMPALPLRLFLPEEDDVIAAARLKATCRISYADAFAAALAQKHKAALVTGDPELREMAGTLKIDWIGAA